MSTTDDTPTKDVNKSDVKAMSDAYNKGATIDDLAVEYGYNTKEVEAAIVTPVEATDGNGLQSEQPEEQEAPKKGK